MTFNESLPELFCNQVLRTPDIIAIQSGRETLSYAALNERANQLAHYLRAQGVGDQALVGICLERSPDLIIAILGVLKAGCAYAPLDPGYPADRLNYMLSDSGAAALITRLDLRQKIPAYAGPVICVDQDAAGIALCDIANPANLPGPEHLAYVIYTSGSTGQPKGVMVEQRGWANYTRAARQTYRLQPGERVLQFASISWDTSAEEIFPCLTSGATLVLRSDDMLDSIPRFLQNCADWGITVINLPTAFWHELVTQITGSGLALPVCLRVAIIGGERAHWEFLVKWWQHAPAKTQLFNTYGQTECTAVTTCGELTPDLAQGVVPIGRPVENVSVYLLDEQLGPVPLGQSGELYVGGPGLARGYLNQPELTAQKFIPAPAGLASGRLYKTGDIMRMLDDGSLEFLGRADQQVKMRGIRIEPGEIEAVLTEHPEVRLAAVVGVPTGPSPEYLAAYVVFKERPAVSSVELRNWLRKSLPAFLVPAVVIPLDALPMTPNGKLDRRALPVPDFSQLEAGAEEGDLLTPTQAELKRIWQEVLGLKNVGMHDDFFEIGGHSLLATRVVARVRQRFNIDLSLRTLFECLTIARLSDQMQTAVHVTDELVLARRLPGDPLLPSFAQESLWFLDQMVPGNPTYNIADAVSLKGPLDVSVLEKAINLLVQRHENLRTRFINADGQPVPVIAASLQVPLPINKAPNLPEDEQLERIRQMAADEAVRPFNLQTGPLLRALLVRINSASHVLLVSTHHIISDGWSIAVFFQELSELYTSLKNGVPNQLHVLPVQFADYAIWQRRSMQGEQYEKHLQYWKEKLQQLSPLHFPLDRPRPAQRSFRGARLPIRFSAEFTSRLHAFSRSEEMTLFMILLAALQASLARYTAQTDITLGTAIANRHQPELDNLIGFFVNTLVLRTNLDGDPTFQELLKRVKEVTLGAYAHQSVPFELIVQSLHPRRVANRNPMFDVMLFLQNVHPAQIQLPGIQAEFIELEQRTAEFDFVFDLTETPDGLQGFCEYDTDLFDAASMARFVAHFQNLLTQAVGAPVSRINSLALLSDDERQQLLVEWNQTAHALPEKDTLPDLFEARAVKAAGQPAAIYEGESLSYATLNARANQLAHHLRSLGVKKETIVGVCLDRSLDLLVAILAILKAGGAYLPLDPAYPLERLQFMLADSQAAWLVMDGQHRQKFGDYSGQLIDLQESAPVLALQPDANPLREMNGSNACYMIYTSGSTGRPKGVIGLHLATLNRLHWMWETYPFQPGEVCCQKTSLSFVDSVWEIFGPLLAGVPLVIIADAVLKDTRRFVNELAEKHVSRLVLVPSLLWLMLEIHPNLAERLPALNLWVSSGEALPQELADEFLRHLPGRLLLNLYGSSEAAADSTFFEIKNIGGRVGIGRPIFNTQTYILDESLQPVPIGVTGEIYIGGAGLARGYWQRPDFNSERFIPHPFERTSNARLYKTGDLGRYWPDGNIEYQGRADFQVKIRGFRVELGEIQNVIIEHPAVKQALVIAGATSEGQRLLTFIVPLPSVTVTQAELRKFVEERLPDYMLPGAWVFLDEFPLTPSGKIDRRALPAPDFARVEPRQPYAAPRDELELRLVKLWERLLEHSPIGIDDNFFEIGGHSLLVVRLMTQLEKELGKPLSLALIFHAPTVALMAAVLRNEGWRPTWSSLVPIRPGGSLPPLFCVHADGGAFFYTRFANYLSPQQPFYGLQARGLDGVEPPFTRVEDMAAHYLAEMRSIQPRGPYLVSGFSMGGVVIYEMARQSVAAGDPPPLVVFIDAPSPSYFEEQEQRLVVKLAGLSRFSPLVGLQHLQLRASQRSRWLIDEALSSLYLRLNRPLNPALRIHRVREMNRQIADEYEPKPYAGPVTILRASEQIRRTNPDPTLGWSEYVSGTISDYIIPGDHETIFHEPNVQVMAQALQTCIYRQLESQSAG